MRVSKHDVIEYHGERHTIEEWCAIKGISITSVADRLRKGGTVEEAFSVRPKVQKPIDQKGRKRQDANCIDCMYSMCIRLVDEGIYYACDYMCIAGERRPCNPGFECTVKKKKTRSHKVTPWGERV